MVYVVPSLVATEAVFMHVVMLVVHPDLSHHGVVHSLGERPAPDSYAFSIEKSIDRSWPSQAYQLLSKVFLAKADFRNGRLHA